MKPNPFPASLISMITFMLLLSACVASKSEYEQDAVIATNLTANMNLTVIATPTFQPVIVTRVIEVDVPGTATPTATPPFPLIANPILTPGAAFIRAVSPPENRVIPLHVYSRRISGEVGFGFGLRAELICVEPIARLLVQEGDVFVDWMQDGEKLEERMELWVDGQTAKYMGTAMGWPYSLPTREPEGPRTDFFEWVSYCWEAPLGIGVHEVTFRFRQTSGDVKEYTWHFELSE